jgi:Conserved mid region of cactin
MMVVCKDRLDRIKSDQCLGREAAAAVEADIAALLQGKSYDHLLVLQRQIQAKLTSGEPVDTDYWEGLLKKLLVWKSKVSHADMSLVNQSHLSSGKAEIFARSCRPESS